MLGISSLKDTEVISGDPPSHFEETWINGILGTNWIRGLNVFSPMGSPSSILLENLFDQFHVLAKMVARVFIFFPGSGRDPIRSRLSVALVGFGLLTGAQRHREAS